MFFLFVFLLFLFIFSFFFFGRGGRRRRRRVVWLDDLLLLDRRRGLGCGIEADAAFRFCFVVVVS